MMERKAVTQSKTIWGGVLGIVLAVLLAFDVDVSESEVDELVMAGGMLVSGLTAIYGRIVARAEIGGLLKAKDKK